MLSHIKPLFKINFRPIVVVFLSFLFGITACRFLYGGDIFFIVLVSLTFASILVYSLIRRKFLFLMLCVCFFLLGNGAYFLHYNHFSGPDFARVTISGRVSDDLESSDNGYSLILEDVFADGEKINNVSVRVWNAKEEIKAGDFLTCECELEKVELFTLKSFNTWALRSSVAYSTFLQGDELTLVSGDLKFDEKVRAKVKDILCENMDENTASVAFAVLTGDKSLINYEITNAYQSSGVIHILSVSGLHITFFAGLIAWILKKLKVNRFVNFGLSLCSLLFYAYICNFTPSVTRAVIMGLILIAANLFGRNYDGLTALSVAGIITLFCSPLSAFDVGFLMSYACVAAIFILHPIFAKGLRKILPRKVADAFALSFATQIGILPFLASMFSSLNLLSFFTNLIIVPIFAILFPMLIVLVLISMIIPSAGHLLIIEDFGLNLVYKISHFFSSTELQIQLNSLNVLEVTIIYMICLVASYFFMASVKVKYVITTLLSLLFCLFTAITPVFYNRGSQIYILSSYSECCAVIESSSGQTLCLSTPNFDFENFYFVSGVQKIDFVIGSSKEVEGSLNLKAGDGSIGDFIYSVDEENFIIDFDGYKIFFANNFSISYNEKEKIDEILTSNDFDFVFVNGYEFSASHNFVTASDKENQNVDFSTQKLGNFVYSFNNNTVWGLD